MKFFSALPKPARFIAIAAITTVIVVLAGFAFFLVDPSTPVSSTANPQGRFTFPPVEQPVASPSSAPLTLSPPPKLPTAKASSPSLHSPGTPVPGAVSSQVGAGSLSAATSSPVKVQPYYGHFPYAEADASRLDTVGRFIRGTYERSELLDREATAAFQQMVAAARREGIDLMPISGFRSIADQKALFDKQIERKGSPEAAAKWSAPPGYSEHHTGYAIDIGDMQSDTDIKLSFQETAAYRWLLTHARQFGFEQSFPENNAQRVSFEPWHWRYVQSPRAASVFAAAKSAAM